MEDAGNGERLGGYFVGGGLHEGVVHVLSETSWGDVVGHAVGHQPFYA